MEKTVNINIEIMGTIVIIVMVFVGVCSYILGKRKTTTPKMTALLGVVLSIIPLLGLIYVAALVLKADISVEDK